MFLKCSFVVDVDEQFEGGKCEAAAQVDDPGAFRVPAASATACSGTVEG